MNLTPKLNDRPREGITNYLEIALAILATGYILTFIILGFIRLSYPYELEWIEGAMIDEMLRIHGGFSIYSPPTINFIPLSYTPLFFYLSASLMRVIGVGFVAPRLISILSTIGSFFLIYAILKKLTQRHLHGVIGAGVFAGCYQFTGAWMDLAKADSLFLFLILASFFISLDTHHRWKFIICGILYAAAFFTKQVAFPIVLILASISLILTKGKYWPIWLTTSVSGVLFFGMLEKNTNGWFSFYCIRAILLHPLDPALIDSWISLLQKMWPSVLISLFYFFIILTDTIFHHKQYSKTSWHYLGFAIALIAGSWVNTLKIWSYKNTLLPTCIGLALLTGLGLYVSKKVRFVNSRSINGYFPFNASIITLIIIQFSLLFYNPTDLIPTHGERQAAQDILECLGDLPGEVLVYNHGFVNYLAGKTSYLHSSALGDLLIGKPKPDSDTFWRREAASRSLEQALSEQRFDWLVIDSPDTNWPPYYIYASEFIEDNGAKYPGRENSMVPKSLLVKNPISRGGSLPLNDPILDKLFREGWGKRETWGRWATGNSSILDVNLEKGPDYTVTIITRPFCFQDLPSHQSMQILWNGTSVGDIIYKNCEDQSLDFLLHKGMVNKETNELRFIYDSGITSPRSNIDIFNSDSPSIGFSLIEFTQN